MSLGLFARQTVVNSNVLFETTGNTIGLAGLWVDGKLWGITRDEQSSTWCDFDD